MWRRDHEDFWPLALRAGVYTLTRRRAAEKWMLNAIGRASYVDRALFEAETITLRDCFATARPRTWWGPKQTKRNLDHVHLLPKLMAPTLILASRHDAQQPLAIAQEIAALVPESELVIFEKSGHFPFWEEPEAFWSELERRLRQSPRTNHVTERVAQPVS